jgi:3-oxoacyl-[acyl-carrier protein] reductase
VGLNQRVAVVTGAAQGIGRWYARALAAEGATVAVADINLDGAEETVAMIGKDGGRAAAVQVDVSDPASTLALAAAVRGEFGRCDILVNNAAIYHSMRMDPQLTVDIAYWRKVFSVNLDGALLCTQALAPMMIEQKWGRIINQTSTAAYLGRGGHYGCSKLAMVALTQGFAHELGPHGITVNAIAPGVVWTEATEKTVPGDRLAALAAQTPIDVRAEPAHLAGFLLFLVSDAAAWVSGQTHVIDGGMVKRL